MIAGGIRSAVPDREGFRVSLVHAPVNKTKEENCQTEWRSSEQNGALLLKGYFPKCRKTRKTRTVRKHADNKPDALNAGGKKINACRYELGKAVTCQHICMTTFFFFLFSKKKNTFPMTERNHVTFDRWLVICFDLIS